MPINDPNYRLEYIIAKEAWWRDATRNIDPDPYISVIKAHRGGGCDWEFQITDRSRTIKSAAVRIGIFDDAFAAFTEIPELFAALAAERPTTLDAVRKILDRIGAVDATERTRP